MPIKLEENSTNSIYKETFRLMLEFKINISYSHFENNRAQFVFAEIPGTVCESEEVTEDDSCLLNVIQKVLTRIKEKS